jgi:hypothetical protein
MLTIAGAKHRFCDGVSRRDFLKAGALGLGGMSLSLADMLRARADGPSRSFKAVIMVCLPGGPTHIDTYDMKPDAPDEIRGEFRPIATNVPGVRICEHLPLQARMWDKFAVVRNMRFIEPGHQLHEVYTGYPTAADRPAFGSIVSRLHGGQASLLPRYISMGIEDHPRTVAIAERPTFAGNVHRPFAPSEEFLRNLSNPVPAAFSERQSLLQQFDTLRRDIDANGDLNAMDSFSAQALDMLTSPAVRDAFDIAREPLALRERYGADRVSTYNYQFGHTWHGSRFLLARRLVEAGVPVVTLAEMGWDHHGDLNGVRGSIFQRSSEQLPWLDQSLSALVTDLHERGLDRDVAVVVWGEFGRTPRINRYGGRDHWTPAGFTLFAGGGFRTGQMIGATDAQGGRPRDRAYEAQNVMATLYRHLGIDLNAATIPDFTGRPRYLVDVQEPIRELF